MRACSIVDASFSLRLLLPGPDQAAYQRQAGAWAAQGIELYAPTLWLYEMTSALSKTVRYGDLDSSEARAALALALRLGVQLLSPDEVLARAALEWTLRMGRAAAYDSFYLGLAERLDCELWTADRRLRNAVDLPWVRMVDG